MSGLREASAAVLEDVQDIALTSYGSWIEWYSNAPEEVVSVIQLRVELGADLPDEFQPLYEALQRGEQVGQKWSDRRDVEGSP